MKIIALIAGIGLVSMSSHAQGYVSLFNISSAYLIYTNQAGVTGPTSATPDAYYYAVLISPYGGASPSANPLDPAWTFSGLMGTNSAYVAGGITDKNGQGGSAVPGWGAPTDETYASGTEMYYEVVGWSSNLGSTWSEVASGLADGLDAAGVFGVSPIGYGFPGDGGILPTPDLFGATASMPGGLKAGFLLSGFSMGTVSEGYTLSVPEPSTMALSSLAGLGLLGLRRCQAKK